MVSLEGELKLWFTLYVEELIRVGLNKFSQRGEFLTGHCGFKKSLKYRSDG